MEADSVGQGFRPAAGLLAGSKLLFLAALALLAYLPLFHQPLIEDDYPNIQLANSEGIRLLHDPVFAARTAGFLVLRGVYLMFGMHAAAYYAAMILLHILNTWLVYALGAWREIGYEISLWAAACFALAEGHQEAIMWISAVWEQTQFLFGIGSLVCWILFLNSGHWRWLTASVVSLVLALHSKESAVIVLPLMLLPCLFEPALRKKALYLAPHVVAVALIVVRIAASRSQSFRFSDGSFSLQAPFWLTWPNSYARLFWFWGLLALIAILIWRPTGYRKLLFIGLAWSALGLVPYSFLTYMTRVPSRQTYLASAGVALIVGCAFAALLNTHWKRWAAVCAIAFVLHNVGYLWTKKRTDFLKRAAPTEQLLDLARKTDGPIYVRCFPRPPLVADAAVELVTGRKDLIWDAAKSSEAKATFCY